MWQSPAGLTENATQLSLSQLHRCSLNVFCLLIEGDWQTRVLIKGFCRPSHSASRTLLTGGIVHGNCGYAQLATYLLLIGCSQRSLRKVVPRLLWRTSPSGG
jgi:hypothetical protein